MQPTRVTVSSQNILDLTFVSDTILTDGLSWEVTEGISDHKATICLLSFPSVRNGRVKKHIYDWDNADDVSVLDYMETSYPAFELLSNDSMVSVDSLWIRFKTNVEDCLSKYIPTKRKIVKKTNPWITREIIHLKRKLSRLRKLKNKYCSQRYKNDIGANSRTLKTLVRNAKDKYMNVTLGNFIKASPDKFWRYLNSGKRKRSNLPPADALLKAEQFNNYFQSVFTVDNGITPPFDPPSFDKSTLDEIHLSEAGILSLLLALDIKKSCGPDNIPNPFLRRYAEWVSKYLLLIYKKSLDTCDVPRDWKIAKVVPIHKSGNETHLSNFRPISLTCTACKIMEHIVLKHILAFVEANNVINKNQHGFQKGRSTTTQWLETFHDLARSVDKRGQADIIFLDLSKAFDRVSHTKLLFKLLKIIGSGKITNWLSAYLSHRFQYVELEGQCSHAVQVTSGVPQGTVLGPILFLLFINDIANKIDATIRLFADDCIIYREINTQNDQILLNNALKNISKWCQDWQMLL